MVLKGVPASMSLVRDLLNRLNKFFQEWGPGGCIKTNVEKETLEGILRQN